MSGHGPRLGSQRAIQGFTLLEAIVAMVVFSLGAFALYGWLSTNILTLDRIRGLQEQEVAFASALDAIRRSNPMEAPTGKRVVGDVTIQWTSSPVEDAKPNVSQNGIAGNYVVGLYTVVAQVSREGRPIGSFYVRQVGWKQVRRSEL